MAAKLGGAQFYCYCYGKSIFLENNAFPASEAYCNIKIIRMSAYFFTSCLFFYQYAPDICRIADDDLQRIYARCQI